MFAFSQIDPETTGSVSEMPVPAMDYLTEGVKAAFGGTLGRIYDYRVGLEEEADMDSPMLSVEEANRDFPITEGWKEPVRESYANFLNTREQKQQAQAFYLNSKQNVAVQGLGFASSMISGMLNPVDLALMFVPVVGKAPVMGPIEEGLLYKGALGQGARFSEAIHKGVVTDYRLEQIFGKYAGIADSTVQGAAFGVMVEPINRHISEFFNEDAGNPLLNIGEMALGAAGMHALFRGLGHAWARLSDDAKLKMMTKGVDDFVKGKDIEVETLAKTDKRWAEEQIRLKEELASLKEIKDQEEANPHHVQIAKDLGVRYDGVQAWIPGQFMAVYTKMDKGNPYTIYMPLEATRAQVKARFKEKIEANKPEPTFEEKVKQIFKSRLDAFRAEMIKPGEKPVIPETGGSPEQHMYSSVLDEIRQKNLRTKEQIQLNFPLAQLTREEAAVLRRSAWNEAEVSSQHDANLKEVIDKANQYLKDNPPGKGVKVTNRRQVEQDMPTPLGLKLEETQHNVLKPEDKTIAKVEEQAKVVEKKVVEKIKKETKTNLVTEKAKAIGLEPQRGPLGKKGYFSTKDPNFTGLSVQITKEGIHLNNIQVPEDLRGKGIGSKKIKELQQLADDLGLPLTLTAEALSKDVPANQTRLEKYYEKLGFERVKGNEFKYGKSKEALSTQRVKLEKEKAAGTIKPEDAKILTDLEKKQADTKESFQKAFMEQLKAEGEARIKALKEAVDAVKPMPDVIKSATDCLGETLL